MWCVPSGQGKGRIEHTTAIIALLLGVYTKVHLVYDCKQLMERDQAEFIGYLGLIEEGQVEYHIGIDFVVNDGELVLVDEADSLMYSNPEKFRDFVAKCACICFTATPDDQNKDSMDDRVLKAMTFAKYHYILNVAE